MITAGEIGERSAQIRRRIARACDKAGRDPAHVALVAVTKTHPAELVRRAVEAGLSDFGENRVQEGIAKIEALTPEFPALHWRLIGQLQSNKAKNALKYFEEIESVDRESLVRRLGEEARLLGRKALILLEVNIGGEENKGGVRPDEAGALLACALRQESLDVRGLMAVPPLVADPEDARPYFRRVVELCRRLREESGAALPELSMGMSHDFEVAVEEGATVVRVGTALFGERAAP